MRLSLRPLRTLGSLALLLIAAAAPSAHAQILPPPPPQAVPEIQVFNADGSTEITSGDVTPGALGGTLFSAAAVDGGTSARTFRIRNDGGANLTIASVTIVGANASDFAVTAQPSSPVAPDAFTTFTVTFDPTAAGTRSATVSIVSNDAQRPNTPSEVPFTFAIQGTGQVPDIGVTGNGQAIASGDASPSAADGTDFGRVAAGQTVTRTFTIVNTGDADLDLSLVTLTDPAGTQSFQLTGPPPTTVAPNATGTFTVAFTGGPSGTPADGTQTPEVVIQSNDPDEATYRFTLRGTSYTPGFSVGETGGSTQTSETGTTDEITVVLTAQPEGTVVLAATSSDDGEVSAAPQTLTFTATNWNTPQTVTLTGQNDALADGPQQATITVAVQPAATTDDAFDALAAQTVTVTNTDDEPALRVSVAPTSALENARTVDVVVSLNAPTVIDVTVSYITGTFTATDEDFVRPSPGSSITIPAGQTSGIISITLIDDALDEEDESFTLTTRSDPSQINPSIGMLETASTTITILDDDDAPTLSIADATNSESDAGATLTVTLDAPSAKTVTVDFATASGTATEGEDFTATSGTLTFQPGTTTQAVTVGLTGDQVIEGNEAFTVALSNAQNATISDDEATVTLNDDDGALQISVADVSADEATGAATLTATLNTATSTAVTLTATAAATGTAETDASGDDFAAGSQTVTIAAGQTSQTFTVALTDDALDENDEAFTVTLSNANQGTFSDSEALVTIQDDDAAPTLALTAPATVSEDGGTIAFTATLDAASGRAVTALFATQDGTAEAGSDFASTSQPLTFAPGQTTQTVAVALTDDDLIEGDETFSGVLSAPQNATLAAATAAVTITDDEPPLTISAASTSVGESAGSVDVTISIPAPTTQDVTVSFATSDATATAGRTIPPPAERPPSPPARPARRSASASCPTPSTRATKPSRLRSRTRRPERPARTRPSRSSTTTALPRSSSTTRPWARATDRPALRSASPARAPRPRAAPSRSRPAPAPMPTT